VADQVMRLKSGVVTPEKFDFRALKFDGARWGAAALDQLAQTRDGPQATTIAQMAGEARALTNRHAGRLGKLPETAEEMSRRIAVYPAGRALPKAFFDEAFGDLYPACPFASGYQCIARFVTLGQGQPEAVVLLDSRSMGYLFEQDEAGHWKRTATAHNVNCPGVRGDLENGEIRLQPHTWPDLMIGGRHVELYSFPRHCDDP
jgi:hypothetical protein